MPDNLSDKEKIERLEKKVSDLYQKNYKMEREMDELKDIVHSIDSDRMRHQNDVLRRRRSTRF